MKTVTMFFINITDLEFSREVVTPELIFEIIMLNVVHCKVIIVIYI